MIKSIPRRAYGVLVTTAAILGFLATVMLLTAPPQSDGTVSRPFSHPAAPAPPPADPSPQAPAPDAAAPAAPPAPEPPVTIQPSEPTAPKKTEDKPKPKEGKYFHEAGGGMGLVHYDVRYFVEAVPYEEHIVVLRNLVRSYLAMMRGAGIDTWIAHGTLLGWWWNERIMPWDYDLDVQLNDTALRLLGERHNMTEYQFDIDTFRISELVAGVLDEHEQDRQDEEAAKAKAGAAADDKNDDKKDEDGQLLAAMGGRTRTYLMDVNPNSAQRSHMTGRNVIDARWIDMQNGMFIDITGLTELDPEGRPGVLSCKNNHRYPTDRLFPLRRGEFEGVAALVPNDVDWVLKDEYGDQSMVRTEWEGHTWNPKLREWLKDGWFKE